MEFTSFIRRKLWTLIIVIFIIKSLTKYLTDCNRQENDAKNVIINVIK